MPCACVARAITLVERMEMFQTDGKGQLYVNFKNIRITVRHPQSDKDWEGTERYLSFRAYTAGGTLMQGTEIPIDNERSDREILQDALDSVTRLTC